MTASIIKTLAGLVIVCCFSRQTAGSQANLATATVSVAAASYVRAIPGDFIGISEDHNDIAALVGQASSGVNLAYRNLLKNLTDAGAGPLSLRVAADLMTPTTELPGVNGGVPNMPQSRILEPLKELAQDVNVHYILGLEMASNHSEYAAEEAKHYLAVIPKNVIDAFEIGNEPDNYQYQGYRQRGSYLIDQYLDDWKKYRDAVVAAVGTEIPFMGPSAAGSAYNAGTIQHLGSGFDVKIYSQHAYPYGKDAANPPDLLLKSAASIKTVGGYQRYFAQIHAKGIRYRIGEMNSISGGGQAGLSDTFQATLWLIDTAFNYAQAGFDGFNFHTGRYTKYNLWEFHTVGYKGHVSYDRLVVRAPYYGMLALAEVMGRQARLLTVSTETSANLSVWATIDNTEHIHVIIVNKDEQASGNVQVKVPGYRTGTVSMLTAPSYSSTSAISLAGQTFDGSTDGRLQGEKQVSLIEANHSLFTLNVPITSTVLLDLTK